MCVFSWFEVNSNTKHGKCKTFTLKIVVLWIMGPHNLTSGYEVLVRTGCLHHLMAFADISRWIFQKTHNHVPD